MAPKPPVTKEQPDSCMLSRLVMPRPWLTTTLPTCFAPASQRRAGLNAVQRVRSTSQANNRALCNATSKAAKCLVGSGRRQEVNSQQTVNHIRALTKNTRCAPNVALANLNQLASKMQVRQTYQPSPRRSESSESTPCLPPGRCRLFGPSQHTLWIWNSQHAVLP